MMFVPSNFLALEFMQQFFPIRSSQDFRGALFVPDEYRETPAQKDHVGVAYGWDNFVGKTCCISIVVQKPECLTRPVIAEAFRFPFIECGCVAIFALVDSTNHKSLDMCRRVGFKEIHIVPDGGSHGDLIVFQMLRSECRWVKERVVH
jgi:RimJ/RimL family protein N-acetyltransferase